jgi:opacity protein-like surface antigen
MKKPLLLLTLLTAMAAPAYAGTASMTTSEVAPMPAPVSLYNANELQFDVFGQYGFTQSGDERLIGEDAYGGGLGVNYFITRWFGIGGEGTLFDTEGDTVGTATFNIFLRAPLGESGFAVYGFTGIGVTFNADDLDSDDFEDFDDRVRDSDDPRDTDDVLLQGHVGLGVEYRFSPNFGVFTDARYTFVERDNSDFGLIRAGVRFAF